MKESAGWQFELEVHPPDWFFPAGKTWLAGWLWSPERRLVTDVRAWIDGRPFLGLWGLPHSEIEQRFLQHAGPPYAGFSLLLEPHAGASLLRLDVRDQTGVWREIFRTAITVARDASPCPPPPDAATLLRELLPVVLRMHAQRPGIAFDTLADEAIATAISEPLNALPNPPFHGALEEPLADGWLRYGRLSMSGWLTHRDQPIRRLTALIDPLQEGILLHGLKRDDVIQPEFADLPGKNHSAFLGHTDLPADTSTPALLKIFAELANGEKHLAFAQRFTPHIVSGTEIALPPLSRRTFLRASRALLGSVRRHGLPRSRWLANLAALQVAWSAYKAEAPVHRSRLRLAPSTPVDLAASGPLRVWLVTHNLNFEGAPWFAFELARHLAGRPGVTIQILSPHEGPLRQVFESAGLPVQVVDVENAFNAASPEEFNRLLGASTSALPWADVDLVIGNTMVAFWAVQAARAAGKPSLLYVHESASIRRFFSPLIKPSLFTVVENAFRRATRVVFTAESTRAVHSALGNKGNFALLPSWVDVGRIDKFVGSTLPANLRRKHGLDPDAVLIVNIGSVCERKGQYIYIQAVDLLKEELRATYPGRKIQFLIIGARPGLYQEMLKEEVSRFGLADWILFVPETGDIFDFYRLADIFCCTSFEESFPRVLLESAAFRLPIITTNVNGIPEMLEPDECWLTPPGDRYRLAEAIKQALAAHFTNDRIRCEKARASVLRKYHEAQSLPLHAALSRAVVRTPT